MSSLVFQGICFGFLAGISPGPFLGLIVSNSILYGFRVGAWIALIPLICDPIVFALSYFVWAQLPSAIVGYAPLFGCAVLIFLGAKTFLTRNQSELFSRTDERNRNNSTKKATIQAVVIQLLNPDPYFFWITIGIPLILKETSRWGSVAIPAFLLGFYVTLITISLAIVIVVDVKKRFLPAQGIFYLTKLSGLLLIGCGARVLYGSH
jgi:threonine/homoserine/homoserine lactone efflux protein